MKLLEFIDFGELFNKVKEVQLREFPTAESYKKEVLGLDRDTNFVDELYEDLLCDDPLKYFGDREWPNPEDSFDDDIIDLENGIITLELSIGGNNATENGDDYWGYGYIFVIDLEQELFIDYSVVNYS